jgi:CRP-like cAMP-binding protein
MPKAIQYRPNSIIFFQGDASDYVYILNAGKVSISHKDIETRAEIRELIKTGEFFGVRSALGRYRRDETAMVLAPSTVVAFTVPEFEQVAMQNTRVIMQMLRVFSTQLRRIHLQVDNLLGTADKKDPEEGLYTAGEFYLKNKRYSEALYAFKQYLVYYPSGKFARQAAEKVVQCESFYAKYGDGDSATASLPSAPNAVSAPVGADLDDDEMSELAKQYYEGVSLMSQQEYAQAFTIFMRVVAKGDPELTPKALFDAGRCQASQKDYDGSIKTLSGLIAKYPKHPDIADALLLIGTGHQAKGDVTRAGALYQKILTIAEEGEPVYRKTKKALATLKG